MGHPDKPGDDKVWRRARNMPNLSKILNPNIGLFFFQDVLYMFLRVLKGHRAWKIDVNARTDRAGCKLACTPAIPPIRWYAPPCAHAIAPESARTGENVKGACGVGLNWPSACLPDLHAGRAKFLFIGGFARSFYNASFVDAACEQNIDFNSASMILRDATKSDWPTILRLNEDSVHFLSPMDEAKLAKWSAASSYLRVVEEGGAIAAFLLAFRKGDDYAGVNFAWFGARYDDFLYVDRIVVAPDFRGRKLAERFYDDLDAFARERGIPRITCEVNIEPPNPVSLRFHDKRGFQEVGREGYAGKTVSMLHRGIA